MRGAGIRGTSIAARRVDLERLIDIAQASHVDRGAGTWERVAKRGRRHVLVMPLFGTEEVRVEHDEILRAALITPVNWEEWD